MNNSITPVDERSFQLDYGDYVWSVSPTGVFLQGGRLFYNEVLSKYEFTADDIIDAHDVNDAGVHMVGWRSKSRVPLAHIVLSADGSFTVRKGYCGACRSYVTLPGHTLRCALPHQQHATTDRYRRLAWLGDAVHLLDVRVILLNMGVQSSSLDSRLQLYTSGASQAAYVQRALASGVNMSFPPLGTSEKQRSTAFEASYFGRFRTSYISDTFGLEPPAYEFGRLNSLDDMVTGPPSYSG